MLFSLERFSKLLMRKEASKKPTDRPTNRPTNQPTRPNEQTSSLVHILLLKDGGSYIWLDQQQQQQQ
ncbi:hypothetical protein BLOT_002863 [Blomia tropicalis]|nr:hypothetical protein BLOT_002863 [Blomia tropicalis]